MLSVAARASVRARTAQASPAVGVLATMCARTGVRGRGRRRLAFTPVDGMAQLLTAVHDVSGMPWWATIAVTTAGLRTLLLPLVVRSMRNAQGMARAKPEVEAAQERYQVRGGRGNQAATMQYTQEMKEIFKRHNCGPLRALVFPLAQAPIFITTFLALRHLAETMPSLHDGGMLWFVDLAVSDPLYRLPILTAATFLLSIELGADTGGAVDKRSNTLRWVMRGLGVAMIPLTGAFPQAVHMYWLSSNTYSLSQLLMLRVPGVRRMAGLDPLPAKVAKTPGTAGAGAGGAGAAQQVVFVENARAPGKGGDRAEEDVVPAEVVTRPMSGTKGKEAIRVVTQRPKKKR